MLIIMASLHAYIRLNTCIGLVVNTYVRSDIVISGCLHCKQVL